MSPGASAGGFREKSNRRRLPSSRRRPSSIDRSRLNAGKNARGGQKCPRRAKTPGFSRARFLFRAFLGAILCALIPCLHPASKWRDFGIKRKRPYSRVVCVDTPPGCRRRRRRRRGSFQSSDWSRLEPGTHRRVMTRRTVRLESGAPGFESKAKTTIPITSVLILIRATNVNHDILTFLSLSIIFYPSLINS